MHDVFDRRVCAIGEYHSIDLCSASMDGPVKPYAETFQI